MGDLELILLQYYRAQPINTLSANEVDEYLYLLVKQGLETYQKNKRGTK